MGNFDLVSCCLDPLCMMSTLPHADSFSPVEYSPEE